ncbi:MAG: putative DNA primase large subunit-like [Trebouxia sp. A1-2]|nr:MAG: putative DNA primase large subunit-like [Trebouxia sp. A1-2]
MAWIQQQQKSSKVFGNITAIEHDKAEASSGHLGFYTEPPSTIICIEDFERYAIDRLRVLKGIEEAKAKGFKPHEIQEKARKLASEHLKVAFMTQAGLDYDQCTSDELNETIQPSGRPLWALLAQVEESKWNPQVATEIKQDPGSRSFFKVDFEQVPDLVASRKVFLRHGQAYVFKTDVASLVVSQFRSQLSRALATTSHKWASHIAAEESERLTPVVEALSTRYLGPDYGDLQRPAGEVALADLPRLAHESFPLCMLNMFDALKRDHHLKHTGRQQLGNFLKGIGLSLESALAFWRTEFAKGGMPEDKFKKEHMYNIRHSYGKEGKRVNYTPASCMSVINSQPGEGVVHGCPYKTFNKDSLTAALTQLRVEPQAIRAAVTKQQGNHFQLACAAAWEGAHGCECVTGINHPNQYYTESRKVHDAQMEAEQDATNAAGMPAQSATRLPNQNHERAVAVTPVRPT